MENNTVALAAISLTGVVVACLVWVVKYFANTLSVDLREHTKAAVELKEESKSAREASQENLKFLKNLNGKLEGAVIAKAQQRTDEKEANNKGN